MNAPDPDPNGTPAPMEWYDVHFATSAGHDCWECGNGVVECEHGCAPFCPCCVGYPETVTCYYCKKPLIHTDEDDNATP